MNIDKNDQYQPQSSYALIVLQEELQGVFWGAYMISI